MSQPYHAPAEASESHTEPDVGLGVYSGHSWFHAGTAGHRQIRT